MNLNELQPAAAHVTYATVLVVVHHLETLDDGTEITPALLIENGIVKNQKSGIKILAVGQLEKKLTVKAHKFSAAAVAAIEQAGGSTELGWTFLILFIYRIGTHITVPGVNPAAMSDMANSGLMNILNIFSGGGLMNYSLFAMGVSPYVTAQIVVQLLQLDIVPRFVEWSKQGEVGRRKLNNATRWLTLVLAFVQSVGITAGFNSLSSYGLVSQTNNVMSFIVIGSVMTIGTFFAMWLGEMITEKGLGNGVSMIIFAGIIAQAPEGLYEIFKENILQAGNGEVLNGWVFMIVLLVAMVLVVAFTTWSYEGTRRLQMQYTRSATSYGSEAYLPLKVNVSGVIPVIFASSFISTPQTVLLAFQDKYSSAQWYQVMQQIFSMTTLPGAILYTVLIVVFTYFYAFVQVNPEKLAENLQKQGLTLSVFDLVIKRKLLFQNCY
ncbi:hypothetical protein Pfo_031135 [Paulownia fortunei]|nr:hypothetical protein Pfo_031135 [Paulownia fortunei]